MADDKAIRSAIKAKTGWSTTNLSQRITRLTQRQLMSRSFGLYVLAHLQGIRLERFGVDDSTLIEVGKLAAAAVSESSVIQTTSSPAVLNSPSGAKAPTRAQKFAARDFHPNVVRSSRVAFTSGLRSEAIRKAFQSVNNRVKKLTHSNKDGKDLMGWTFSESSPQLQMTPLATESEQNEHNGLRFLTQGAILGIRNPRSHDDHWTPDSHETSVLELLGFASYLHRCLDRCEDSGT